MFKSGNVLLWVTIVYFVYIIMDLKPCERIIVLYSTILIYINQ